MINRTLPLLAGSSLVTLFLTPTVYAQSSDAASPAHSGIDEIVVTAQKRAQSINEVGISITAATGDTLTKLGVSSTADLARIVPGLTAQPSPFNTPVYTLRGVGFYDSTLAASPTVAVYTDEVPLPFSAMTKAAGLDIDHVEVLKGPQGTLFGQNTTGGAINYIAAKPTPDFAAGFDASYGRFNTADLQGFVSGPLASTVNARLSLRTLQSGDWQKSFTRSDSLGETNLSQGRLLVDWTPTDQLTVAINLNGWKDDSDSQAPQRWKGYISVPTASPARQALSQAYPLAPSNNARAADWGTDLGTPHHDDDFTQGSVRVDYAFSDAAKLTSITAYERYETKGYQDYDGTTLRIADVFSSGHIDTFSQELRLSGDADGLIWVVGGNYESDNTFDFLNYRAGQATTSDLGPLSFDSTTEDAHQDIKTTSVFGNVEYPLTSKFSVIGGLRYTDSRRKFTGCTNDSNDGNASAGPLFDYLQTLFRADGSFTPIPPGGCITLGPAPDYATFPDEIHDELNEKNLSWRAGINYTNTNGLLYASVSKGYKAGSFPNTAASASVQYLPVSQESLTAYELGFKQSLFDWMQLNGAVFYYDYSDKQLRGRVLDPVFGPLDALVQIPQSNVKGAEIQAILQPLDGLKMSVAATYLKTEIEKFVGYDQSGTLADYKGSSFPYAPKWTVVGDGEYEWSVGDNLKAFVGSSLTYNSATSGSIGTQEELRIKGYTLIDLRAGIATADDIWRFQLWGRNVTDTYYWTNATQTQDGYLRYAGRPVTYGATLSYRFQ